MLFQKEHNGTNYFMISTSFSINYKLHFHAGFELVQIFSGELEVTVDNRTHTLTADKALLIFPYQLHSYWTVEFCKYRIIVFSPDVIEQFYLQTKNMVPKNPVFDVYHLNAHNGELSNLFEIKGFLYFVCGALTKQTEFEVKPNNKSSSFIETIFNFVEENYMENCSLKKLSELTKYDYSYISRYFTDTVGNSYNQFVSERRVSAACELLLHTDLSVTEIAGLCGFNSLRNLNRTFLKLRKSTPKDYRCQNSF